MGQGVIRRGCHGIDGLGRHRCRTVVTVGLVGLLLTACASTPTTKPRSTGSTSTSATSTTPRTALDGLGAFFAAATQIDSRLKVAAADANGAIGTTQITITRSTLDAISAADPAPVTADIPAGLTPAVLLPVLTVQSDLESRYWAFRGFEQLQPGVIPRTNPMPGSMSAADYLLTCLGDGSAAARSFPADMAAARTAASKAPPVESVDPSSRTAADLAIWLHHILESNSGCEECGGQRFTELPPISWHYVAPLTPGGNSWDGDMAGGLFTARYVPGQGWTVQFNAC
jgi:hypothetical protein